MIQNVQHIFDILFPRKCPLCGKILMDGEAVHTQCLQALKHTEQHLLVDNNTEELFGSNPHFCRGMAYLFVHKHSLESELLHALKFRNRPEIGSAVGRQLAQVANEVGWFDGMDVLMPVPLHRRRYRQRGYNQSEWIARGIQQVTGLPIDTEHLVRVRNNPMQSMNQSGSREKNVHQIFEVNHPEELFRQHILLVDDMITTGATLRSCMEAMREVRGAKFSVIAIGRAR